MIFLPNWESQFLGRLIRSLGSLKWKKGSGALKEELGVWNSQEEKDKQLSFSSTFLSLSHIKHLFSLSLELMITQQTTQFKLCTKDYITTMYPALRVSPSRKFSSVQSLSHVQLFATPWTAACQAPLSITNSWSLLKLMSIESVMPSNHLMLSHPLLLQPSIFPCIRVFSWVSSSHQVARVLEFQLQHQSFQ